MPEPGFRRLVRWLLAGALGLAACVPGPGACRLPPTHGRVVDSESGAPIAGATVFEWWRGAGVGGGPQPTRHLRFATSDEAGRFAFPEAPPPGARMWVSRVYEPSYGFFHPDYGLVRGPAARDAGGALSLSGSRRDAPARLGDLARLCESRPRDGGERELAARLCPERSERPPERGR